MAAARVKQMTVANATVVQDLERRLSEAEATIEALLSGQIDAVVDSKSQTPVLLSQAQAALHASEARLRRLWDCGVILITISDLNGKIVEVNEAGLRMLGYSRAELVGGGLGWESLTPPEWHDVDDAARAQLLATGVTSPWEKELVRKDGSRISILAAAALLDGSEGIAIAVDLTERKQAEQAMRRSEEVYAAERKKLQSQLMVSDRMASVGTLAAGVAHEINNPLAAVIGSLEYIADSLARMGEHESAAWFEEQIKEPLADAREAAQRVRFIVRDLKIFSRAPSDELTGPVDVVATLESSLRMAWNEIRHRARLVKRFRSVPGVTGNEARLGQVFLNLIVNAAQAVLEGHAEDNEICVSTRLDDDRVIVEVTDTGAGIPPEILGRVFDAFFTTKPVGAGSGLGLAICHRIVSDMGGELTVESELGKGSTFRVALPIADHEESGTLAAVPQAPVAGRRGRILVVDDEEIVLRSVKRMLSREHDVVALVAAKEALALCAGGEKFDLILCDLMMPDMTGMDLHRELSRVAPAQANRMIFLTGGAFTAKARSFLSENPKEHLEKPFDPANLRAIVQRYLQWNV